MSKASFFDKRFSKLSFLAKLNFEEGKEIFKKDIVDEIKDELSTVQIGSQQSHQTAQMLVIQHQRRGDSCQQLEIVRKKKLLS